jgi:hypothetical protein
MQWLYRVLYFLKYAKKIENSARSFMVEKIVHCTNLVPSNECGFGQFARVVIFFCKNVYTFLWIFFFFFLILTFVTIFRRSATNTKNILYYTSLFGLPYFITAPLTI